MLHTFAMIELSAEGVFDQGFGAGDCADEESSPLDTRLPIEPMPCRSPLRVAPSDGSDAVIINREHSSNVFLFLRWQ